MSQVLLNPCQSPDIKHPQEAIWVNFNISLYNLNEVHFRMIPLINHGSGLRPGPEVVVTFPDLPRSIDSTGKNSVHG